MKLLIGAFRTYCTICGFLVGGGLLALGLAWGMDVLPRDRIESAFGALQGVAEAEKPKSPSAAERAPGGGIATTPEEMKLWELRLSSMGERIETDVSGLGAEQDRLNRREQELRGVGEAIASLLSVLAEESVDVESLVDDAPGWVARLEKMKARKEQLPKLLETLGTMEPKALATILSGGGAGLDPRQTVELLKGLSPRKAGEVLTEMGKLDPSRAGRLIALLREPEPRVAKNEDPR